MVFRDHPPERGAAMRKIKPLLSILIFLALLAELVTPIQAAAEPLKVYYNGGADSVLQALTLAGFEQVTTPLEADVLVVNGSDANLQAVSGAVNTGKPLLLMIGPNTKSSDLALLLGGVAGITPVEKSVSLVPTSGSSDPLTSQVVWTSSPQIHTWYKVDHALLEPIIETYEDHSLILGQAMSAHGKVYVFTGSLTAGDNNQFQQWAYYNYLIYNLVSRLGGVEPLSFGKYNASPVPHATQRVIMLIVLGLITAAAFHLFWRVRRYSQAHPEALDTIVADSKEYVSRQASTAWDRVGFHRPLGGFLFALLLGLVLFIPLIIYQNMILPAYILPSAQALGIWGRVTQFFAFLWQFFDMGTSIAFIKFYSQYRVHDPRKDIQYGQLFVWWQLLSGAIQVALVTIISSTFLPETAYALYAWSIILHAMVQIPGFLTIMRDAFTAHQRFDYAQILDLSVQLVLPMLIQPIFVTIMVIWGRNNPIFGPAMGGVLGLGISAYMVQVASFGIGWWLYHRLGYNARVLFLALFNWDVIKSAFRFGVFEMLGSVAWAAGQAMEIVVTQTRLINYAEIWGNWGLAQNFIFAFNAMAVLFNNLMPSMSEAFASGRKILSRYYSAMAYKWGGMISAFIGAILLAVADKFILGASGPDFKRAASYAIPLIIWGAVQFPSWVGDNVQLAANKPYLKSILVACEQALRVLLAFLLIGPLQVNGLIIAYFIGLLSKDFVGYFINNRVCFKQAYYFWQSLAAPLLAGAVHYFILRWLTGLIWKGDQITSIIIFFIGILPSYPLYAFLYAFAGGWDDDTLEEFHQGTKLASFMQPLAWLFWKASVWGAKISPLHNAFPISIRAAAVEEAASLTDERVQLI